MPSSPRYRLPKPTQDDQIASMPQCCQQHSDIICQRHQSTLLPTTFSYQIHLSYHSSQYPAHLSLSAVSSHRPNLSLTTSHFRRELGAVGFVSRQQRLSCSVDGFHCGLLPKQRDGKAKTLAPRESRAVVSPSLYRRLMVSLSQPLKLTLAK